MIVSKRRERLPFKTRVVRRIEDVPPDAWNKAFPDVLESYNFLKTLDESNLEQFSFYYILAYEGKKMVAATPCFLTNYSLDTSVAGPMRRFSNAIKKIRPNIFSLRVFVCGIPMGPGRIGIAGDRDGIVHAILRRIEQIAKKKRCAVVAFKDFYGSSAPMLGPLRKKGFLKLDSLPTTELKIEFKDFEEYIKTLSAASRYDLRRKFRKVDGRVKIDMQVVDSLDDDTLKEIYRLYLAIVEKHEMGFELLTMDFFRNISKNMPGKAKYFLWHIDGKLVAFLLCLISEERLIDYYVGLDYDMAYKHHLYFIKFRDIMNWCIENRIKIYEMGITGYEPKRRLGFDFVPLYLYIKLRNRLLRPAFNLMCQFLKFENFDPALKKGINATFHRKGSPDR